MPEKSQYLRIAVAVCAAYVAAHFIIRVGEHLYLNYPDQTLQTSSIILVALGLFFAIRWLYQKLSARAKRIAIGTAVAVCLLAVVGYFTGVAIQLKSERVEAAVKAKERQQAKQSQQSEAEYYDKLAQSAKDEELRKSYLEFKGANAAYEGTLLDYKEAAAKGLLPQYHSLRRIDTGLCTITVPGYYTERQVKEIVMKDPACK